jgi:hypothetical protein
VRKLIALVLVLAVLLGVLSIIDVVVREGVQSAMSDRIESKLPGSHADVKISSFPFLGHLAASDTVPAAGVSVSVDVSIVNDAVVVAPGHGLPSINVPIPVLDILPCVGSARIVPGALRLSCRFHTLPGLLSHTTFHG